MGSANELASTYLIRPVIAITICALVAFGVQDVSTTLKQLSLATPVAAGLGLSLVDMNRRAFAVSGFAGAIAFGFVAAALDVADTETGYDITFLVEWVLLSGFTGGFVYAINFIWAAVGAIGTGIDEIVELRSDAQRRATDEPSSASPQGVIEAATTAGSAPIVPAVPPPTGVGDAPSAATAAIPFERPANFDAEELVASLEAYQVNGRPWWKCDEPNVMVQYRDRAQLEIESRVVPGHGWRRETTRPPREGVAVRRKPGMFSFSFSMGQPPVDDDLTVVWTRG